MIQITERAMNQVKRRIAKNSNEVSQTFVRLNIEIG